MRNFLTFVAVALVTALTVALVAPPFIDWSAHRQMVARAVAVRIGAAVEITGPITLRLLPTPYLQAAGVAIGPQGSPWLSAKAMRFEFGLANLVEGRLRLDDVVFDRPRIHIGPGLTPPPAEARLEFGHIRANHAEIRLERPQGPPLVLHDLDFDGAAPSPRGPWRGGGDFAWGDARASFQVACEGFSDDGLALKADIEAQGARAEFDGRATLGDSPALTGVLTLSGVVDAPGGGRWPWRVAGEVASGADEAAIAAADVRLGSQARALEATGRLALRWGEAAGFEADLTAKTLNFDALLRGDKETSAPPARAIRVFSALAQQALTPGLRPASFSLKLASSTAYLGARALEAPKLSLSGAPERPMQLSLEGGLPGHSRLKLDGELELGVAPIFRGHGSGGIGDFAALAAWAAEGEPALAARMAALGAALPSAEIAASADVELSPEGYAARALSVGVANSHFEGGVVYRLASDNARARLFLDLATDTLDIDAAPNVEAGLDWLGDSDLDFRLKAQRLRVARVGLASVDSGSLDLRARKEGQKFTLEKLSLADFGGASIEAEGETSPGGRWTRVKLDAAHLTDFAALLARAAPSPLSLWLQSRAEQLGPAKATFEARRDGPPPPGPFPLDFLKADGSLAGARFGLTLSRAPAPVDALSAQVSLDAPDAGALLRKLGARIPSGAAGRGELSLSGTGQWSRGFDGKARLALAGAEIAWSGALHPDSPDAWATGPLTLKTTDLLPALASLGAATTGFGAAAPADLTAKLQAGPEGAHLEGITGTVAGSHVSGALAWTPQAPPLDPAAALAPAPPSLTGGLELDHASLGGLLSLTLGRPAPVRPGALWPELKFGPALLKPPGLAVALKIGALDTGLGIGRSLSGQLRMNGEQMSLDDAAMMLNGGQVHGRLELRRAEAEATASGTLALQGVGFERPNGRGRIDLDLDFAGGGETAAALVGGLAGAGQLKIAEGRIGRLDPEALSRAFAKIEAPGAVFEEKALEGAIGAELDKGPLTLGGAQSPLSLSSGALRFGPFTQGAASVSGEFHLSDGTLDLNETLTHAWAGKFWSGPPPSVEIAARDALDAPARKVDASLLSAGLASEAIARENDRMENFEADVRERAMFNRRRKAELFLARRAAEIAAFEEEQERRRLAQRYISAYEAWAASREAAP